MKFLKNKKGQAFESFRFLIAFVIAIAVLTIIYTMVNTINQRSIIISTERLQEGSISASKSIGTSAHHPFHLENLMLSGRISSQQISNYTGMKKECIYLDGGVGLDEVEEGKEYLIKKSYLKMDVYFYCDFTSDPIIDETETNLITSTINNNQAEECPTFCIVYLNKAPPFMNN
jgi:hypothetical protein